MRSFAIVILLFGIIHMVDGQTRNKWIIKMGRPLDGLCILIQHGGSGVPVYDKSDIATAQIVDYLKGDTLLVPVSSRGMDFKYFNIAPPCDKFVPPASYKEYYVNYNGRDVWVKEIDLMRVNRMQLGEYRVAGRILHAAIMLSNPKVDGNQCASITTIVMHDDQRLYLIDATRLNNPLTHWKDDLFFSLVNPPNRPLPEASLDANKDFVLTWENLADRSRTKLTLTWADNRIVAKSYNTEKIPDAVFGLPDDTTKTEVVAVETVPTPKDETVYTDDIHTDECSFASADAGDCGHIEFSCGDFGDADTGSLSSVDRKLWSSVIGGAYSGRRFAIRYKIIQGRKCGAPDQSGNYYRDGPIQQVLSFKLK